MAAARAVGAQHPRCPTVRSRLQGRDKVINEGGLADARLPPDHQHAGSPSQRVLHQRGEDSPLPLAAGQHTPTAQRRVGSSAFIRESLAPPSRESAPADAASRYKQLTHETYP